MNSLLGGNAQYFFDWCVVDADALGNRGVGHLAGGDVDAELQPWVAGGGPGDATTVPAYEVYNRAFRTGDVGTASAIGVCIVVLIFLLTLLINRVAEREAAR